MISAGSWVAGIAAVTLGFRVMLMPLVWQMHDPCFAYSCKISWQVFNGMRNNVTIANLRPQIMACQEDVRRFEAAGTYLGSPALFEPTAIIAVGCRRR